MLVEIKSVSDTVVDYVRKQIITGKLRANQKLNENDLANSLGVSRPPLREAFRILENEHLLVSIPRKGTYVTDVSIEDLKGLFQTREMIESYTMDLLKATETTELPDVEKALDDAVNLAPPSIDNIDEMLHFHQVFSGFHTKIVEAAGNARINHFYKTISLNLTRYQVMYLFMPGSIDQSLQDHLRILNFIKKGECDKAKESLLSHLKFTAKVLTSKILQNHSNEEQGLNFSSTKRDPLEGEAR
ncbi:MAG: GntR family transcriptional regulator [Syntrophobacteraceae bacterium]